MIVAIEGLDAAGKATQVEAAAAVFRKGLVGLPDNFEVETFAFPNYSSPSGEVIGRLLRQETILLDSEDESANHDRAVALQSLMISNRIEQLPRLIKFVDDPTNLLILDRYKLSSRAYGVADGLDPQWVDNIQSILPDANLTIVIDITVAESIARRPDRRDAYERNGELLRCVREEYHRVCKPSAFDELSEAIRSEVLVDGMRPQDEVTNAIVATIWSAYESLSGPTSSTLFS